MSAGLRWVDAHCHLPDDRDARADVLADARAAGVTRLVTVGCDVPSSQSCARMANDDLPGGAGVEVWASAGVHPHDAKTVVDESGAVDLDAIEAVLDGARVVAVGECGLDYFYDHSPRQQQREVFAAQVALAHRRRLPLVIHTRDAWDDTFAVLDAEGVPERTVLHCFTGGPEEARRALDRGILLSFSGIVTFKAADDLRAAAAQCPLDRLLIETDSPYLAPVPHRGRKNRPGLVPLVGAAVAEAQGRPVAEVAAATWATAAAFFGIG